MLQQPRHSLIDDLQAAPNRLVFDCATRRQVLTCITALGAGLVTISCGPGERQTVGPDLFMSNFVAYEAIEMRTCPRPCREVSLTPRTCARA